MPQVTASQNTSSQKKEPHCTPLRRNTTMKQSQTHKPAKKGWRKSGATPVNTCYKNRQSVSGVAKIGKYCGKHKKPRKNRQIHSQMCANNRNKAQQSVKKKAKTAAQWREKQIKTTIGKAPGRHAIYRIANSNPKKKSARPTNRGNCDAEHAMHNKTSENNRKQSQTQKNTARQGRHASTLPAAQRGSGRRQDTLSNGWNALPKKRSTPAGSPADSTDQTEQKQQNKPYQ